MKETLRKNEEIERWQIEEEETYQMAKVIMKRKSEKIEITWFEIIKFA